MEVLKNNRFLIFLTLIYIVFLIIFWGRFGDPVIDCGREAYIPYAMGFLDKILFKDIICIYGPVPYYLNAILLRFFGTSLNAVWAIGAILAYIFLFGYFKLAKRLMGALAAFCISLLILFCCIFSASISNFIFPYSFAIVYALVFAVFHMYSLVKFIDTKKSVYLYISAFLIALCVLSKLDFLPCIIVLPVLAFVYKKNISFKTALCTLFSFIAPFIALFIIFLIQKVSFSDLAFNFKMISNMAHSPSLQYFYNVCTGYFFKFNKTFMFVPRFIGVLAVSFFTVLSAAFVSKIKNNWLKYPLYSAIILVCAFVLRICFFRYIFLYLPLLLLVFVIFKGAFFLFKNTKKLNDADICIYTILVFSLLFSLKSLFGLFHELYGTFYIPFILLSACMVLLSLFKKYDAFLNSGFLVFLLSVSLLFLFDNSVNFLGVKNFPVKTPAGTFYTTKSMADYFNRAIWFLEENLSPDDTFVLMPEGLLLNFVLKNNYPYFNTSFTPLDFDAYGENYLAEQFLANKPKYLLVLSRYYGDYGKSFMCQDFGGKLCNEIIEKYSFKIMITSNPPESFNSIRIFERKD